MELMLGRRHGRFPLKEPTLGPRELCHLEICPFACSCNLGPKVTGSEAGNDVFPWLEQKESRHDSLFSVADGAEGG